MVESNDDRYSGGSVNDLEKYFAENAGRLIHKWKHYFEIYDGHFSRFRGREVNVVEFGIGEGGSLQMWKWYFGDRARIYGVDIKPKCKEFEEERVEVLIGDQEDRTFLRSVAQKVPRIDILIDDGGHKMQQQINTFEELFPHVDENGVYLCEDLHTSYWLRWRGGHLREGSFIEYSKRLIDQLNAWHANALSKLKVNDFTKSAHSMHFYNSVLVIEKRAITKPYHLKTGGGRVVG